MKKDTKTNTTKKVNAKKEPAIKANKNNPKTNLKKDTVKKSKPVTQKEVKKIKKVEPKKDTNKTTKSVKEDKIEAKAKQSEITQAKAIELKAEPATTSKKNKINYKSVIIAACIVIAIIAVFSLINGNKKSNRTIKLSDINEVYVDTQYTITLPNNWMISNDGELFEVVDDRLASRGAIMASSSSLEEYEELLNAYGQYYELENVEINGQEITKLHEEVQEKVFTYYLSFNEGIVNQVVFIDTDEALQKEILSSIK